MQQQDETKTSTKHPVISPVTAAQLKKSNEPKAAKVVYNEIETKEDTYNEQGLSKNNYTIVRIWTPQAKMVGHVSIETNNPAA